MIKEKIATSLNGEIFSNKHILTKIFADSQFMWPLQLILIRRRR